MTSWKKTVAALPAVLLLCGCGAMTQSSTAPATPAPVPAEGSLSAAEFEAIFRAREDSARMRFTDADVAFVRGMIGHHAQALVMGGLAPERTETPAIRTLAARIINSQRDEIRLMQTWLERRDLPVPEVHVEGTQVMVHGGVDHDMSMPGMLTPAQLRELENARGAAFDRLFLQYMIRHHQGAVTMVRELFATDGALQDEDVFRLASDVQVDQITEIERMELMLSRMPGSQ